MVDIKEATRIAKEKAADVLGEAHPSLEEIERELYKGRDAWSITLGFPREPFGLARFSGDRLEYKRFLIDSETGELLAIKIREIARA